MAVECCQGVGGAFDLVGTAGFLACLADAAVTGVRVVALTLCDSTSSLQHGSEGVGIGDSLLGQDGGREGEQDDELGVHHRFDRSE